VDIHEIEKRHKLNKDRFDYKHYLKSGTSKKRHLLLKNMAKEFAKYKQLVAQQAKYKYTSKETFVKYRKHISKTKKLISGILLVYNRLPDIESDLPSKIEENRLYECDSFITTFASDVEENLKKREIIKLIHSLDRAEEEEVLVSDDIVHFIKFLEEQHRLVSTTISQLRETADNTLLHKGKLALISKEIMALEAFMQKIFLRFDFDTEVVYLYLDDLSNSSEFQQSISEEDYEELEFLRNQASDEESDKESADGHC